MHRNKTAIRKRGQPRGKLVLHTETVRQLQDTALKQVVGGQPTVQGHQCDSQVHCL